MGGSELMSMHDPIADMLTRIRNGQRSGKGMVEMPASKLKCAIAEVLKKEGYIQGYSRIGEKNPILEIELKYYAGKPVIEMIKRISRPGLRIYRSSKNIPSVMNGLGITIVSTSHGLMTDRQARTNQVGGELLCIVA